MLVTLSIVSHNYSSQRSTNRSSIAPIRPSSKRDPLTVTADGLKPDGGLEKLLKENTPSKNDRADSRLSGHERMDASFSSPKVYIPENTPKKAKSKSIVVAGPSSWTPGGRGVLDKYAEKAERASALFEWGSHLAIARNG